MIMLFRVPNKARNPITPVKWGNVVEIISTNEKRYRDKLLEGGMALNNEFYPLIDNMGISPNMTLEEVIVKTSGMIDTLSATHGLSYIREGKVLKNVIGKTEVYISVIDVGVDFSEAWQDMSPFRAVSTTTTDLSFRDLTKDTFGDDTILYELDLVQLGIMFFHYTRDRTGVGLDISIPEFIYQYLLPNSFRSLFNLALINRFIMLSKGINIPPSSKNKMGVTLRNIDEDVEDVYRSILKSTKFDRMKLNDILSNIPVYGENSLEALRMRYVSTTLVYRRFAIIARLRIFNELMFISNLNIRTNQSYITDAYFAIKGSRNANGLDDGAGIDFSFLDALNTFDEAIMEGTS